MKKIFTIIFIILGLVVIGKSSQAKPQQQRQKIINKRVNVYNLNLREIRRVEKEKKFGKGKPSFVYTVYFKNGRRPMIISLRDYNYLLKRISRGI